MTQCISKSVLVAEIERRIKNLQDCKADTTEGYAGEISGLKRLLSFLDTLEVKEVDLEAELNTWRHNHFNGKRDIEASGEYLERITQLDLAKHFYELGLKAKGE